MRCDGRSHTGATTGHQLKVPKVPTVPSLSLSHLLTSPLLTSPHLTSPHLTSCWAVRVASWLWPHLPHMAADGCLKISCRDGRLLHATHSRPSSFGLRPAVCQKHRRHARLGLPVTIPTLVAKSQPAGCVSQSILVFSICLQKHWPPSSYPSSAAGSACRNNTAPPGNTLCL